MSGAGDPRELVLLTSLRAFRGPDGRLGLTRKYLEGAAEYARGWPGPVTTLARLSDARTTDMDHMDVRPEDLEGMGLEVRPKDPAALARRLENAALVHAFLAREEEATARTLRARGVPLMFYSEYSPRTERQIIDAETANPALRLRRRIWAWRTERARRRALRLSVGIQCSGTPTYEVYAPLHPNALLFFDNRVRREEAITEAELERKAAGIRAGRPLRLIFGGRLIAMKGVMDLPRVATELVRREVPFTLDIYGAGPLEEALRREIAARRLGERLRMRGVRDFRAGWIPALKAEADLFLCCHPQGDPSSTYPEAMSCGLPIAGYDNEAFAGVAARSGAGWTAPTGDPARLAATVARLHADRGALAAAAAKARAFGFEHVFEVTAARRVAHMRAASRLPDARGRARSDCVQRAGSL